jgi:hypothetical protein
VYAFQDLYPYGNGMEAEIPWNGNKAKRIIVI